ncbi:uncharacterized protein MONBRDRAFT_10405 [Monosiga brevicollis MX1]|uniref:VWFA domain-containing protein n=1 Tax=Monosiga brevicollis TaxID=81824 RepID=A9V643_MONBE|nr:uncharacterized protein MONBRDRAFT_10405 [Monosiga brevicollis MX1]EDQ86922.1 predicted protein [Monosiga brevicollis MX1]|eukprot:XP_001748161.1 hypothetical protein [Monosiga brevicollis MX1]
MAAAVTTGCCSSWSRRRRRSWAGLSMVVVVLFFVWIVTCHAQNTSAPPVSSSMAPRTPTSPIGETQVRMRAVLTAQEALLENLRSALAASWTDMLCGSKICTGCVALACESVLADKSCATSYGGCSSVTNGTNRLLSFTSSTVTTVSNPHGPDRSAMELRRDMCLFEDVKPDNDHPVFGIPDPSVALGTFKSSLVFLPIGACTNYWDCTKLDDPRFTPWYAAAASGPKDVVLNALRRAALEVLKTLSLADYFGVVLFNDDAYQLRVAGQEPNQLVQATRYNIDAMIELLASVVPSGETNYQAAVQEGYALLRLTRASSGCHRALLFATMTTVAQALFDESTTPATLVAVVGMDFRTSELTAISTSRMAQLLALHARSQTCVQPAHVAAQACVLQRLRWAQGYQCAADADLNCSVDVPSCPRNPVAMVPEPMTDSLCSATRDSYDAENLCKGNWRCQCLRRCTHRPLQDTGTSGNARAREIVHPPPAVIEPLFGPWYEVQLDDSDANSDRDDDLGDGDLDAPPSYDSIAFEAGPTPPPYDSHASTRESSV